MPRFLFSWIAAASLALAGSAPLDANAPPAPQLQQPLPAPKVEEPKKIERDGSAQVVHFTLAGIGVMIVMILVCMPLRRE